MPMTTVRDIRTVPGNCITPSTTVIHGTAYITTEGASYSIDVATQAITILLDSANGNADVVAGTVSVDPGGSFAYAADASASASNANVYRIATSTGGLTGVTPMCTFASSTAVTAVSQRAYYTCAGSNFIQAIDTSTNSQTAVGHVTVGSGSAHPQGIAIPYDGVTAYVGLDDGTLATVDIATDTASPAVGVSSTVNAIGSRPVTVAAISPLTPSVPTGRTQQFSSALAYSKNGTLTWTVNGLAPVAGVSGNATVGTIDSTGLYTAPQTIPVSAVTI